MEPAAGECQSNAETRRGRRSPAAEMKATRPARRTRKRSARGSRRARAGVAKPALRLRAASAARERWAAQSARVTGSSGALASGSPSAVAGRWRWPLARSMRARAAARLGAARWRRGNKAQTRRPANRTTPKARARGGTISHRPNHDTARNSTATVPAMARGGQSPSHTSAAEARRSRPLSARGASRTGPGSGVGLVSPVTRTLSPSGGD